MTDDCRSFHVHDVTVVADPTSSESVYEQSLVGARVGREQIELAHTFGCRCRCEVIVDYRADDVEVRHDERCEVDLDGMLRLQRAPLN